ncbi:hypothetical protein D3C71_28610 [compost metagenome]
MHYKYVQVTIKLKHAVLGNVKFAVGEDNNAHYIRRADILSRPYLFQEEKGLQLRFEVTVITSEVERLTEVFIPKF